MVRSRPIARWMRPTSLPLTFPPAIRSSCHSRWRLAEVVGAEADRHRRERARLFRLSRLPPGVPRGVRADGGSWRRAPASRGARSGPRAAAALTKAEIITLGMKLGLDYGLTHSCYSPQDLRRAPVRPLRQLPAARQGVRGSRNRGSMTERLYYTDPYLREFDARVVRVDDVDGARSSSSTARPSTRRPVDSRSTSAGLGDCAASST